ncbi:MAG TPA: NUDIX hydrolase [Longilinea sp.]|nr:NUDIX hydrolase [Longilinea sp.]
MCGSALETIWNERERETCPHCGWAYYPQLKLSAAGMIVKNDNLLLVRRVFEPWKDCWYLPAGYVEIDEDPRVAARREVLEETGLIVHAGQLLGGYYFDDDPRGNGFLLIYECRVWSGELILTPETNEAGFFSREQLPQPLAGAGHERAILDWRSGKLQIQGATIDEH